VEVDPLALRAACRGGGSDGHKTPKGKNHHRYIRRFMRYLFDSAKALFKISEPNGELRWNSISGSIELVLTHPNGWGGPQQTHLRNAAIKAGIVPDTPAGHASVHFVTEGEASFSFCAIHTQAGKNLKVCRTIHAQSCFFFFFDTLAAWRAGVDYRCGWWNRRYQYLQGSR